MRKGQGFLLTGSFRVGVSGLAVEGETFMSGFGIFLLPPSGFWFLVPKRIQTPYLYVIWTQEELGIVDLDSSRNSATTNSVIFLVIISQKSLFLNHRKDDAINYLIRMIERLKRDDL
jgi:hypothetical protein